MRVYQNYITFETAILAKEKGFTLGSVGSHVFNYFEDDGSEGTISWGHLSLDKPAKAPQYLLQKWLRESHYIHILVVPDVASTWSFSLMKLKPKSLMDNVLQGKKWVGSGKSYEEALELGLQQALKLIQL